MLEKQMKTQQVLGCIDMTICDRTNEADGLRPSWRTLSWRFAQGALSGVKYALTVNGYMVLP
jgi:hypothetical protein